MEHAQRLQISSPSPAIIERVERLLPDLPTIRFHQLSMTAMEGQTLMLVRIHCLDGPTGIGEGMTIGDSAGMELHGGTMLKGSIRTMAAVQVFATFQ